MSKVIFLDVDGTLCNYEGVIPESAKQAIKQARKNGHKVYICTGRSRAEVYQEIWDIGLDGMIGGNGSYVEDQSKSVYHKKLSETEERAVVDWLHERGLEFFLGSYQDYLDARETFSDLKAGTWGGKDEEALFGDLGVKGIDKASAIDVLLEHLNAKKADTIAFGDAKVDIPMFEYCEQSVCLGNGGDEAKKAADMVTQAVDDDGLASAFYKLGLI